MEKVIFDFLPLLCGVLFAGFLAHGGVRYQQDISFFHSSLTENIYVPLTIMAFLEIHTFMNFMDVVINQGDSLSSWYPFIAVLHVFAALAYIGQQTSQGKALLPIIKDRALVSNGMMIYLAWYTVYNVLKVFDVKADILPLVSIAGVFGLVAHGGVRVAANKPFFFSFLTEERMPFIVMSILAAYTIKSLISATHQNNDNLYGLSNLAFHAAGMGFLSHYGVTLQS